jgi:3-phenylpropionate/trans-cinnamate dioxygenase ferredoxin subunit
MSGEKVFPLADLEPGTAKKVVLDGIPIAVVRDSAGNVHAIGDTCTHGEISLSEGFVEEDSIECWAHGSRFGLIDGQPRNLPAYEPVPVFAVEIVDGDIYVNPSVRLAV